MENIIVVKASDEIQILPYTGLESLQKAVGGYIEHFHTTKIVCGDKKVSVHFLCDEEFLIKNDVETYDINAFASMLSANTILGNIVITAVDGNGETRGFMGNPNDVDSECSLCVASIKSFFTREAEILKAIHDTFNKENNLQ